MRYIDTAIASLEEAQKRLGGLIAEAAGAHEYAQVAEIAALASGLKEAIESIVREEPTLSLRDHKPSAEPTLPTIPARGESEFRSLRPSSSRNYPKFEKERDRLVKIGWSKRDRRTYEHRAPREAVAAVVAALSKLGQSGELFTIEEALPIKLQSSGQEVPSYQVYLALALLRETGAVGRRGRDGYALANGNISPDQFNRIWDSLPEHT